MKVGIIIQGSLINNFSTESIIETYKDYKDYCIVSTWKDEDKNLIKKITDAGFNIILNDKPSLTGIVNTNLQILSTQIGINYLEPQEYTHYLKIRSDLLPSNVSLFLDILTNISTDNLIFLSWIDGYTTEYFVDFFNFGPNDKMKSFWGKLQYEHLDLCAERYLCYNNTGILNPKYEDIKHLYKFCINELYTNNVKLNWTKADKIQRHLTKNTGIDQVYIYMNLTNDILKNYKN